MAIRVLIWGMPGGLCRFTLMSALRSRKNRIAYWTAQISGWSVFVALNVALSLANEEFNSSTPKMMALIFVLGLGISHLQRAVILKMDWLDLGLLRLVPRVLALSLLLGGVCFMLQASISDLLFAEVSRLLTADLGVLDVVDAVLSWALLLTIWSTFYFIYHYFDNYRREEIKNLQLESSMREIELNSLKNQLNPHFMFNSMNSIRALVDEDPELAKTAITQLSTILRNSLIIGKRKTIPLEEELKVVRSYLALESIRYEERLQVNIDVPKDTEQRPVPPLMLQTLVENAVKHGISKLTDGGIIDLKAVARNGSLYIRIENSGKFEKNRRGKAGIGLANTRKRLELLYGTSADLQISNKQGMVCTEIKIPDKTAYENLDNR